VRVLGLSIGGRACAIPLRLVDEVLPIVPADAVPGSPPWLIGMAMLRGRLVPLIDGGLRLCGSPVPCTMNARTVLLVPGACEPPMAVALRVERVHGVCDTDPRAPGSHPGLVHAADGALGAMTSGAGGMITFIEPGSLLTPADRALFRDDPPGTVHAP
jgi:chemotaxis signal transduction protein